MAMKTETLEDKLLKLAEVNSRIGLATAKALTRIGNASPEKCAEISQEIDDFTTRSGVLQIKLGLLGQK